MDHDCNGCLYKNVVEGLSEGFSRIDAIHAITNRIVEAMGQLDLSDRDGCAQAAVVAVDTIIRAVDGAKERGDLSQP